MTQLPRQIHEAAFSTIEAESRKIESAAVEAGGEVWAEYQADMDDQKLFLDSFEKTFNVARSLRRVDVSRSRYTLWRSKSIYFVERFNSIIEMWHDDIYVSAATRAKGYLTKDETTDSGFVEDADGNPVYFDADTKLTAMFLKSMYPEFNEKVDLDMKSSDGSMSPRAQLTPEQQAILDKVLDEQF